MTFTVMYRGKDGALREETVEATGRSDCLEQMRARGIVPVSVKEGARKGRRHDGGSQNGRDEARPSHGGMLWKTAILVAVVLAVAAGLWWWLVAREDTRPAKPKAATVVKDVKSPKAPQRPPETAPAKAGQRKVQAVPETNQVADVKPPKERHDTVSIHTNNLGKVVEKWIGADGKLHMSVRYARKPVFDNASDDQLAMAMAGDGAQSIAPIPMTATSEQEFLESLKNPIVINDDDPEKVKQIKTAVSEARAQMKQMIDNGMSYREALAEHQRLVNENVDTRNQCMAELKSLVDAGDHEGAERYMKTMNVALGQMGIPALTMPMSREELSAARQRRREEKEAAKQDGK